MDSMNKSSFTPARKVLLYRDFEESVLRDELITAQGAGFSLVSDRNDLELGDVVVPRFYPFYDYLEDEIREHGATLVRSNHGWVSDLRNWSELLSGLTPRTWTSLEEVHASGFKGPFFVKGVDKSMKSNFLEFCYAEDLERLPVVLDNLTNALFAEQQLVIREFIPLKTYGVSALSGMPIAHELRLFVYEGKVLSEGFYWEDSRLRRGFTVEEAPAYGELVAEVARRVEGFTGFYALDIALSETGEWLVIELNDGCLAGLSANSPEFLYGRLFDALETS